MFAPATEFETAPLLFRRRRAGRFSSRSPSRPAPRSRPGFRRSTRKTASISSRAASGHTRTSRHDSMHGLSTPGLRAPGLTAPPMARRTKAAQIYEKTGNLRAVQLLLGHTKLESTVRYLGIEVDDALNIAEQIEL